MKSDSRYIDATKEYGPGSDFWRATSGATGLLAGILGGNVEAGVAAGAAPYVAKLVKDATAKTGAGEAARIALHGIVSAALAEVQGGNTLGAAAGGMASAALVGESLSKAFYGKDVKDLDADQRTFISNLATAVGAAAGGSVGGDTFSASSGANAARVEVENNALSGCTPMTCTIGVDVMHGGGSAIGNSGGGAAGGAAGAGIGAIIAGMFGGDEKQDQPNAGKDLSDADKAELGGTGSGTPGGWGPEDEENARNNDHQSITVEDLTSSSSKGQETTGRSKLFERTGGSDAANKEFDALAPSDIKDIPSGRVGKLPDGRTVIVRERSTDGRPTLEIQSGKNRIKFRYDE